MSAQLDKNFNAIRAKKIARTGFPRASKRRLRIRVYVTMAVLDCAMITAAFILGDLTSFRVVFTYTGINLIALVLPIYLMIAGNRRIYSASIFTNWRQNALATATSFAIAVVAVLLMSFYLQASGRMSHHVFGTGAAAGAVLLFISRWRLSRWAGRIVGGKHRSEVFIRDSIDIPADVDIDSYDAELIGIRPDIGDPMMLNRLGQLLSCEDRVIVGCPVERRENWAMALKGANINGEILVSEMEMLGVLGASRLAGRTTLVISSGPLDTHSRAIKRALDLSLAAAALLALTPLLLVTAIAIRLDSPGPIFFKQQRLGRGNRLFAMYKFRSMRSDQCDANGNRSTQRNDDRITRVGGVIRANSIDELPQLLNILIGDMSFVGPRPHALGSLAGDKLFWEIDQRYWHRHASKPGLTGLAQVRGFRGATHLQSDLVNRLQADLEYLDGWSIWRDISILFATFRVLIHKNAY